MTLKLGVLISGRGSNLQAILNAVAAGQLDADVRLVVSNRKRAAGLQRASEAGVSTQVVNHRDYSTREQFDETVVAALREAGVEWVVLAGFMRIVTPVLLNAFKDRVINIHPSLLPAFPGVDAQAQALAYGVRVSGCTVHLVNEGVDNGPIIAQAAVPVFLEDTRDDLAARILEHEHRLLVKVLQGVAQHGISLTAVEGARPQLQLGGMSLHHSYG